MLRSVPGLRSSPGLPGTVTRPRLSVWTNCLWLPLLREEAPTILFDQLQDIAHLHMKSVSQMSRAACLNNGKSFLVSRAYDITSIVDRVGSGDSFAGGLLYGMQMLADDAAALELAAALSCLKHSTYGDFSRARLAEVNSPLKDGGSGRVQR